jgi:hypothetical protein
MKTTSTTKLRTITSIEDLRKEAVKNHGIVNANVDLRGQLFPSLPDAVIEIRGNLWCYKCTALTSFGNLQSVAGYLDCSHCPALIDFGNLQSVGSYLNCGGCTALISLGNLQSVGSYFDCGGCTVLTSFGNLQSVGSNLWCCNCPALIDFGNLQSVGGYLWCNNCLALVSFGNLQSVGSDLSCCNCPALIDFGNLQSVGNHLNCYDCPLSNYEERLIKLTTERVYLRRDEAGRLHCEDRHAVVSQSHGRECYWRGVNVPDYVILQPEKITIADINTTTNAEVRRVKIFRYGLGRWLHGTVLRHDEHAAMATPPDSVIGILRQEYDFFIELFRQVAD